MIEENILGTNLKGGWRQLLNNPLSLPLKLRGRRWGLWLAMLFFFLLPWQTRYIFRGEPLYEWGTVSAHGVEILGWIVILFGLINFKKIPSPKSQIPIIGLVLFSFVSIFWAPDKLIALQAAIRLLEGVLLFVVLSNPSLPPLKLRGGIGGVICVFIAGAVIQSLLGIYQFLTQTSFASTLLGMASHDSGLLGSVVVEVASGRWLRAYGGLPHPNVLGGYLVIALVILGTVPLKKRGQSLFLLILLTGIFFSFSRTAWIAVGLILIIMFTRRMKHNLTIPPLFFSMPFGSVAPPARRAGVKLCFILGYIIFLIILFHQLVFTRVMPFSAERLEVKSRVERVEGIQDSWALIKQHPILGVGIGNYTQAIRRDVRQDDPLYSYQPVHNVFLLIWAELGIVGLFLFLFALYKIFKNSKFFILHSSFFILLSMDHYLWSLPFGVLLFWGILGLSTGYFHYGVDKKTQL